MADKSYKFLLDLRQKPGNNACADCGESDPEWTSWNLGVFLCEGCAGVHRSLGAHISKVKSIRLDKWEEDQLRLMESEGNIKCQEKYEQQVPPSYRRPCSTDVQVLKEQWIRAKYERLEFTNPEKQTYLSGRKEGYMWKRGKDNNKFQSRRFVLSETENTLKYYNKEDAKTPKATLKIDQINVTFVPDKIGNLNGLQITYDNEGSTRNLFLYTEEGKDIVDWYNAIRSAKLNILRVAFPGTDDEELISNLTRDFLKEGWLYKTGPNKGDAFKKRWFTLDNRKLMYYPDPLDPFPKGEVFLGYKNKGNAVREGVPPGFKTQGYPFTIKTPERNFVLSAEYEDEQSQWMEILKFVIEKPLTPQDSSSRFRYK
ncbi:unnamed protein product [Owenia fusiformis]|uniref:Uncharacterized protein n=1 Tax=Owenia fusiformis TaxID=6347 RepID=A0A8J1UM67_OWEFU|nr:unnamed protein product [Owenia fusiformis]